MTDDLHHHFQRFRNHHDVDALGQLFDIAAPQLQRVAGHLARDTAEAEDLLQETFVQAMQSAGQYDPEQPVLPWLLGILTNQWRYRRRQAGRTLDGTRMQRPAPEQPDAAAQRRELSTVVLDAIRSLPQTYREVVESHLVGERRAADVARRLDRPAGTVRMQLMRGLERLRLALPAGLTGGAVTVLAPESLATVRLRVIERARDLHAPAAVGGAGILQLLGTLPKALLFLGTVAALSLVVWLAVPLAGDDVASGPDAALKAPVVSRTDSGELSAAVASGRRESRSAVGSSNQSSAAAVVAKGEVPAVVIDVATGQPVPGAEVWFLDHAKLDRARAFWDEHSSGDADTALMAQAQRCIALDDGELLLPKWHDRAQVIVQTKGGRSKQLIRADRRPPIRLLVYPRQTLEVQVRKADGSLACNTSVGVFAKGGRQLAVAWTGDAGTAKIHVDNDMVGGERPHRIGLSIPLRDRVEVAFPAVIPADPLELALPEEVGSVEASIAMPEGLPMPSEVRITVWQLPEPGAGGQPRWTQRMLTRDGAFRIPFVGIGMRLGLEVDGFIRDMHEADGPQATGGIARVQVTIGKRHAWLMGRILGADSKPLENSWVDLSIEKQGPRGPGSSSSRVQTGGAGEFLLMVPSMEKNEVVSSQVLLAKAVDAHGKARECRKRLPAQLGRGRLQLGALRLATESPLVSGYIVDDLGAPVAGARVSLWYGHGDAGMRVWGPQWQVKAVRSDARGWFQLRGHTEKKVHKVKASCGLYRPAELEISLYQAGVKLEMPRAGGLEGTLGIPGDLPAGQVTVVVAMMRQETKTGWSGRSVSMTPDASGFFELESLPVGRYELCVQVADTGESLLEPRQIAIEPKRVLDVTAGGELTVTGPFHKFDVSVTAAQGELDEIAELYRAWPGELPKTRRDIPADARRLKLFPDQLPAQFYSRSQVIEAIVFAEGFTSERVRLVAGCRQKIRLTRSR